MAWGESRKLFKIDDNKCTSCNCFVHEPLVLSIFFVFHKGILCWLTRLVYWLAGELLKQTSSRFPVDGKTLP